MDGADLYSTMQLLIEYSKSENININIDIKLTGTDDGGYYYDGKELECLDEDDLAFRKADMYTTTLIDAVLERANAFPITQDDDVNELVGQLIDIFEDFLENKGITSFSKSNAIICGPYYDKLATSIKETLKNWGVIQ